MFCGKKNLDRCGRTLPIIGTYCITIITILSYTAHTNIADWVCVHSTASNNTNAYSASPSASWPLHRGPRGEIVSSLADVMAKSRTSSLWMASCGAPWWTKPMRLLPDTSQPDDKMPPTEPQVHPTMSHAQYRAAGHGRRYLL